MISEQSSSLPPQLQREWLITNGLGGYAMGALDGSCLQTHHALLVMPVRPPLQRLMYVRQLNEALLFNGQWQTLSPEFVTDDETRFSASRAMRFALENGMPRFEFSCAGIRLSKYLWMPQKGHGVCVRYELGGEHPARLRIVPYVSIRDVETNSLLAESYFVRSQPNGILVYANPNEKPCAIIANRPGRSYPVNSWKSLSLFDRATNNWQYEEVYLPSALEFELRPGENVTLILYIEGLMRWSNEHEAMSAEVMFAKEKERRERLALELNRRFPSPAIQTLAFTAHHFLIERATAITLACNTILAGYPYLTDWGRDAMIALPGLLLTTRHFDVAKSVFALFLKHAKNGLIPNYFPSRPESPNYESLDATLWMFVAIYEYWQATQDKDYLDELYPLLLEILHGYMRRDASSVKLDSNDGLLFSLEQHRPMTWMNASAGLPDQGNWLATPRHGKAIEVQALWYNALRIMKEFAEILGKEEGYKRCNEYAELTAKSMLEKFWCAEAGHLFDGLIDTSLNNSGWSGCTNATEVGDPTLRPNQIIAVGLPFNIFSEAQTRAIVEVALQKLVTPYGLRTLAPEHPAYCGQYIGSPKRLAAARHNGCAYPWLIWPFVRAYMRAYNDSQRLQEMFEPIFTTSEKYCLGHIAEMYDGDRPHHPRGAPAYAASTGAVLQSWQFLQKLG